MRRDPVPAWLAFRALPPSQRVPLAGCPKPSRCAITAASVRLRVPSLARMFETCSLAVLAAMKS